MPRRTLIVALLLTVACTVPVTPWAFAAHKPHALKKKDYKHEIEQVEEQWRAAEIAGDVSAMDMLLSDDYVGISINGMTNTKAQQLDRLRNKSLVITKMDITDTRIKLVGAIAIVTGRSDIEGTNDGVSVDGTVRYTRVYQRLPSGVWKITNFEVTRVPNQHNRHEARANPPAVPSH
jgi:ketosteroid isomerase-like protein